MNDNDNDNDRADAGTEEDVVGRLLHLAGPRPAAPEEVFDDVRAVAHTAWRAKVRSHAALRKTRRIYWQLAAAAVLVLAAGATFLWQGRGSEGLRRTPVATVVALRGEARLLPAGGEAGSEVLRVGAPIPAGATLATGADGRLGLRLASGVSARLDHSSRLELRAPTVLALAQGAVYLDSGNAQDGLAVHTPRGVARDIGTQFELRLLESGLHLQVRDGAVELEHAGIAHAAPAGTRLTLTPDGSFERAAAPSHGEGWDWILDVSPVFELEGHTVGELLGWAARETGWQISYADPTARQKAATSVAHGSIEGLTPREALDLVLPGSGLAHRVDGGRLVVTSAGR